MSENKTCKTCVHYLGLGVFASGACLYKAAGKFVTETNTCDNWTHGIGNSPQNTSGFLYRKNVNKYE